MSKPSQAPGSINPIFESAASPRKTSRRRSEDTRPFSIRLTAAERAHLKRQAGRRPLGQHIRTVLLGDSASKRQVTRRPQIDDQQLAALLSGLGQSRLSSNLNQLAKSANMGTLDVDDDIRRELHHACAAVIAMREALLIALRMSPRG
ncbi:MAG: hypothetical protein AB7E72_01440 [Lysobacterales bacterium]